MNSATVRNLLVRGMLAGLVAGVLALVVAYFLGEPRVDGAIALRGGPRPRTHEHEVELVSRACSPPSASPPASSSTGSRSAASPPSPTASRSAGSAASAPRATALLVAGAGAARRVRRAVPEVPGQPAGGRRPRHHRQAHRAVLPDGRAQRAAGGRRGDPGQAPRAAPGQLERDPRRSAFFVLVVGLAYAFLPSFTNEVPEGFPASLLWRTGWPRSASRRRCGPRSAWSSG